MNMHVNPTLLAATAMNYKANPHTLETKMDHQPLALSDVNEDNFSKEQMEYCGILIDCHADYAVLEEPVSGEQFVFKGCRCMPDEFGIYRIINTLGVLQWADLRKKVPPRSN